MRARASMLAASLAALGLGFLLDSPPLLIVSFFAFLACARAIDTYTFARGELGPDGLEWPAGLRRVGLGAGERAATPPSGAPRPENTRRAS